MTSTFSGSEIVSMVPCTTSITPANCFFSCFFSRFFCVFRGFFVVVVVVRVVVVERG